MCAGAARQDIPGSRHLLHAAERLGIIRYQAEYLVEQVFERDDPALAEVDESFIETVAHRPPTVFPDEHRRIHAPALVRHPQPVEHAHDTDQQRRQGYRVVEARANVHDARLERRVSRTGPQVPPDARGVFDQPRIHQDIDVALVLRVARESLRQTGARQRIKDCQTVTLESRIAPLPERRRAGQGEQVRQEIRHLVHQVDAQFVVVDADMNVHAADEQSSRRRLHFDSQGVVTVFLRLLLFRPATERVRRRGDRRHSVTCGYVDDDPAQPPQLDLGFLDVLADLGADLDLRPQQLRCHLRTAPLLALGHKTIGWIDDEAARLFVDQQVLFFYANCERGPATAHRVTTPAARLVRRSSLDRANRFVLRPGRRPGATLLRPRRHHGHRR